MFVTSGEFVNISVSGQSVLAKLKVFDVINCGWGTVDEGGH